MGEPFEFDVAISFCGKDEALATQLDDILKERFKTFIYSRKQERLAGGNGEKLFNEVFGEKARTVVILYRPEWGESGFTQIEQIAIRNRAFNEGYDFTLWIALEENAKLPPYVERTRIYYGLQKYGLPGVGAVVEQCIQRAGGNSRPETLAEKGERLRRQREAQEERDRFLGSQEGVNTAAAEARALLQQVEERSTSLNGWQFNIEKFIVPGKTENWLEVKATNHVLAIEWHQKYANTLSEAKLEIALWKGLPPRQNRYFISGEAPPRIKQETAYFGRTLDGRNVWRIKPGGKEFSTDGAADYAVGLLLDAETKDPKGHS